MSKFTVHHRYIRGMYVDSYFMDDYGYSVPISMVALALFVEGAV